MIPNIHAIMHASVFCIALFFSFAVSTDVTSASQCDSSCVHSSQFFSVQCNSSDSCTQHDCFLPMKQWGTHGYFGSKCGPSFVPYPTDDSKCENNCFSSEKEANENCIGKEKYCKVEQCSSWLSFFGVPVPPNSGWICRRRFVDEVPSRPLVISGGQPLVVEKREKDGIVMDINVEVNDNGIVDSNVLKDEVTFQCTTQGETQTVKIKFASASKHDLLSAARKGSIFIVPVKQYPKCVESLLPGRKTKSIDAYIYVEKIEGTETEVVLTGKPSSVLSLYKSGFISIGKSATARTPTENSALPISARVDHEIEEMDSKDRVANTVKGEVKDSSVFNTFTARWGVNGGLQPGQFESTFDYTIDINTDLSIFSEVQNAVGNIDTELTHVLFEKHNTNCPKTNCDFFEGVDDAYLRNIIFEPTISTIISLKSSYNGIVEGFTSVNHKVGIDTSWSPLNFIIKVSGEYNEYGLSSPEPNIEVKTTPLSPSQSKTDFSFEHNIDPGSTARIDAQLEHVLDISVEWLNPLQTTFIALQISTDGNMTGSKTGKAFLSYTGPTENEGVCNTCHMIQFNDTSTQKQPIMEMRSNDVVAQENGEEIVAAAYSTEVDLTPYFTSFNDEPMQEKMTCAVPQFVNASPCDDRCCDEGAEEACRNQRGIRKKQCVPKDSWQSLCYVVDDPHIVTFDGARYDCQTQGEYVFIKSEMNDLSIHSRFRKARHYASVDGVAVKYMGTTVEISEKLETAPTVNFGQWPVVILINKRPWDLKISSLPIGFDIKSEGSYVVLTIGMKVEIKLKTWKLNVRLVRSLVEKTDFLGLCGTPNGNGNDDFKDAGGDIVKKPVRPNEDWWTTYCTDHWKITREPDSLFYWPSENSKADHGIGRMEVPFVDREDSDSFKSFNNVPINLRRPPINNAPQAVKDTCGEDEDCILDGVLEGVQAAKRLLETQVTSGKERLLLSGSTLSVTPSDFQAGALPKLVTVKVDLRETGHQIPADLQSFSLFLLDQVTKTRGNKLIDLLDDGSSNSGDEAAGDMIFTGQVAIRAEVGGKKYSFSAVPVISGTLSESSPLQASLWDGLISFSEKSGLGEKEKTTENKELDTLSGTEMVMSLTWEDSHEVEFRALFWRNALTKSTRCNRRTSKYLSSGGSTPTGFSVIVALDKAEDDGLTKRGFLFLSLSADIVTKQRTGAKTGAIMSVFLRDAKTKVDIPDSKTIVRVTLGETSSCARKRVAFIRVKKKNDKFTMSVYGA